MAPGRVDTMTGSAAGGVEVVGPHEEARIKIGRLRIAGRAAMAAGKAGAAGTLADPGKSMEDTQPLSLSLAITGRMAGNRGTPRLLPPPHTVATPHHKLRAVMVLRQPAGMDLMLRMMHLALARMLVTDSLLPAGIPPMVTAPSLPTQPNNLTRVTARHLKVAISRPQPKATTPAPPQVATMPRRPLPTRAQGAGIRAVKSLCVTLKKAIALYYSFPRADD